MNKARRRHEPASGSSEGADDRTAADATRLLVIEDEPDLQELLRYNLSREGFEVKCTERGELGVKLVREHLPDLVVLDLMLPGMDGLEVCRELRKTPATARVPILMLTAKDQEDDIVAGLEMGADDYVTKPYHWRELLARIRAVLRRNQPGSDDEDATILRVRNLVIDRERHRVSVDDQRVTLTATEFNLLHMLARQPGRVFTRQQVIQGLHGELAAVSDRAVDVQVVSLRRKLAAASGEAEDELIETVRGVGYRFKE